MPRTIQAGQEIDLGTISLTPLPGAEGALDLRFFAVTTPVVDHGEFEIHCLIKNIGDSEVSDQFKLTGTIQVQWLTKEIDETVEFTLKPGEVYDYIYKYATYKGNAVRAKVTSEWGWNTPTLEFEAGYFEYGANLAATEIGADYVFLRYAGDDMCDTWKLGLDTDPAEQTINFPTLKISGSWPTIYHLVTGLLSGRKYKAWCTARDGGWRTGRTEFIT